MYFADRGCVRTWRNLYRYATVVSRFSHRIHSSKIIDYLDDICDRRHHAWRCSCVRWQHTGCIEYIADKVAHSWWGRRMTNLAHTHDRRCRYDVRTVWLRRPRADRPYIADTPCWLAAVDRYHHGKPLVWSCMDDEGRTQVDTDLSLAAWTLPIAPNTLLVTGPVLYITHHSDWMFLKDSILFIHSFIHSFIRTPDSALIVFQRTGCKCTTSQI